MGNVIRKTQMPGLMKAVLVVKVTGQRFDAPAFTQMEMDWIAANVKEEEFLNFLWKARLNDPLYQCLPDSVLRKPEDPPATPEAKAAMQDCFQFLGGLSKRKNT